jgi:hypothetical protein
VNEIRLPKKFLLSLTENLLGSVCEPRPSRVFESCLLLSISRAAVHHAAAPILRTRALLLHAGVRVTGRQPQHIQVQRMQAPEYRAAFAQGTRTSSTQRQQTQYPSPGVPQLEQPSLRLLLHIRSVRRRIHSGPREQCACSRLSEIARERQQGRPKHTTPRAQGSRQTSKPQELKA